MVSKPDFVTDPRQNRHGKLPENADAKGLNQSPSLKKVRGIALGGFTKCDVPPNIPSLSIEEVLGDRLSDLNIPIVSDLPFGHDSPNAALPMGVKATLDADQGILEIVHEIKSICDNNEQ